MKQRINTVKEEWKKLLTFGALGWVKSSQIWEKIGSTSPVTRHGSEGGLWQMKWREGWDVVAGIYGAS
jgi:hypothetical protein